MSVNIVGRIVVKTHGREKGRRCVVVERIDKNENGKSDPKRVKIRKTQMETTWSATFLIVFREALEAGIVIGIIFTVLNRLGADRYYAYVTASIVAAVIVSLGANRRTAHRRIS